MIINTINRKLIKPKEFIKVSFNIIILPKHHFKVVFWIIYLNIVALEQTIVIYFKK